MIKTRSFIAPLCSLVVLCAAIALAGFTFSQTQEQFLKKCRAECMKNRRKDCGNVAEQLRKFITAKSEINENNQLAVDDMSAAGNRLADMCPKAMPIPEF